MGHRLLEERAWIIKMKIALFPNNGSINSKPVFEALIEHLQSRGENISINEDKDCDVAVIWSVLWSGRMVANRKIWDSFQQRKKPVVVLEVGGLKRNITFKMGINGINREADFANDSFDSHRWPKFNLEMKPWRQHGKTIIICGQHDSSHQWRGKPSMSTWMDEQIAEIRRYSSRPILVRPHPRNSFDFDQKKFKDVIMIKPKMEEKTYDDTDFKKVLSLHDAWAVVNHSANTAIESVINGVPVFVGDASLCYDVGNHSFANVEDPHMPCRIDWANRLAYTEWTTQEIREGLPWSRLRKQLLEKYIK